MKRNPRSPISYFSNPKKRSEEKLLKTIEFLVKFKFSTRKLILLNLKLALHSHHRYFLKLESQGILEKINLYSIKGRNIYILGPVGKELASKWNDPLHQYLVNPIKLNYLNVRHSLSVQKAMMDRSNSVVEYKSEYEIKSENIMYYKIPDAILYKEEILTAFEIELTAKSDKRLYQAFFEHLQNIIDGHYNKVIYVFHNLSLREYYVKKFLCEKWIKFKRTNQNRLVADDCFNKDLVDQLKDRFSFVFDEEILEFW